MLKRNGITYLPAEAAAEAIGTTHLKVLMLLRQGRLLGELVDGAWYVSEESFTGYRPAAAPHLPSANCHTGCGSRCGSC